MEKYIINKVICIWLDEYKENVRHKVSVNVNPENALENDLEAYRKGMKREMSCDRILLTYTTITDESENQAKER